VSAAAAAATAVLHQQWWRLTVCVRLCIVIVKVSFVLHQNVGNFMHSKLLILGTYVYVTICKLDVLVLFLSVKLLIRKEEAEELYLSPEHKNVTKTNMQITILMVKKANCLSMIITIVIRKSADKSCRFVYTRSEMRWDWLFLQSQINAFVLNTVLSVASLMAKYLVCPNKNYCIICSINNNNIICLEK